MKKIVKRKEGIIIDKEITILSKRLITPSIASKSLWLERYCVITGKKFAIGDSVSIIMYEEDGKTRSGGCLTKELITCESS